MEWLTVLAGVDRVVRNLFNKPRQEMNASWILGLTAQREINSWI